MIHPMKPGKPSAEPKKSRRAVVHIEPGTHHKVTVVTNDAATRMGWNAWLNWLTDSSSGRNCFDLWLAPESADWGVVVPELVDSGYDVSVSRRQGEISNIRICSPGEAIGGEGEGASWLGRSSAGMLTIEPGLSAEEQAAFVLGELDNIDAAVREYWPGASLGTSLAATAINCFRTHLVSPIGCSWVISRQLRALGAYGGGRIEHYGNIGATYTTVGGLRDLAPHDVDLDSAYPTVMSECEISGEWVDMGPLSCWGDPCTISVARVTVPDSLLYPPLRVERDGGIFYPSGSIVGCWTGHELRAARDVGCTIDDVISVFRFTRREEFGRFAEQAVKLRKESSGSVRKFAKGLSVQLVGALASKPSTSRLVTNPKSFIGLSSPRPGIWEEERFRPSEREVLSSACDITGIMRSWMARVLHSYQSFGIRAIYSHTDGSGTIGDPTQAIASIPCIPKIEQWKIKRLSKLEVWAANQRISTDESGKEEVVAGGISRSLSKDEVRYQMRSAVKTREAYERLSAKRKPAGDWSEPLRIEEVH